MPRSRVAPTFVVPLFALCACSSGPSAIERRATELEQRAAQLEPSVTPVLVALAEEHRSELVKLEHRLKSHGSTVRKLKKIHVEEPDLPVAGLELDDSLRYTMRIDDEPPGHHVETVKKVLAALEARGHQVVRLKNYWPPNDNYSGINSVLEHPSGMQWELQFHTSRSLEVNQKTRAWYEELREVDTPIERKRELFDMMSRQWDGVEIPKDVLVPHSLHEREEIRERPRP